MGVFWEKKYDYRNTVMGEWFFFSTFNRYVSRDPLVFTRIEKKIWIHIPKNITYYYCFRWEWRGVGGKMDFIYTRLRKTTTLSPNILIRRIPTNNNTRGQNNSLLYLLYDVILKYNFVKGKTRYKNNEIRINSNMFIII